MTSATPWLGTKRVAFVPLYRTVAEPPDQIPADWPNAILRRVVYDPQPQFGGADRSLRAWVRAASSGRADIDPVVLPMRTVAERSVEPIYLDPEIGDRLRNEGMHAAVLVTLGERGAGSNMGFWSRVAMVESNGTWLMEIIHGLTDFTDLYHFDNDADPEERSIGWYDQMSSVSQTHPTALTKNEIGWLDARSIRLHTGFATSYRLQYLSLPQSPVAGCVAAVRIGNGFPYVMVEARKMTDQFDAQIRSEGVIAYRVQKRNFTELEREGNRKPLYLMTLTALQPGQSAALDNGITLSVVEAVPGGFDIRIQDEGQHLIDRTVTSGAHVAAGAPCALVIDALGIEDLAFRDTNRHMNEIWRAPHGEGNTDLTASAGAPAAAGDPSTYFDPAGNQVVLTYRGEDNHVRTLYWMSGAVGHDNLTGSINAPRASGNPMGWFSSHDGVHHVVYRTGDGHVHELSWQGQGAVTHADLTLHAHAITAAGDPWPYYDPVRATSIVAFRATDGRLRSLYRGPDGGVGHDNLSGVAGTPNAAGDPCAWYTAPDDTHRVLYRATNGHVIELSWANVAPVTGRDLSSLSGAPAAAGGVSGGYNPANNTQHAIFAAAGGILHELWQQPGDTAVYHVNLTAAYSAPAAASRPVYYQSVRAPNQHVAYRGANGHIYELAW